MQRIVCHSSQTDWRSHYGDLVKAKGRLPRIYNEAGYIDIHNGGDSVSYHYWLTDHLGSVHAVVDVDNQVEQAHDYTVSGIPATRLGQVVDDRLHTAKPWQGFNGLGWYDNRARVLDVLTGRFTTPDPLAEEHPWESPYLFCSGNPVKFIDPTGLFSLENIDKNSHYPLIVVFPQQFATDRVLKMDYEASHKARMPMMLVENVADFADAMSYLSNDLNSETGAYAINSHGSSGSVSIGDDKVNHAYDFGLLKDGLNGKKVFLEACNVAVNGGEKLIEKFSSQTNSTVIAPTHPILAGYQYDGSNGLTRHPIVNSIVGLIGKNYSNEYKMSVKGASAVSVFNLSIDKDAGFSWDKGNKNIIKRLFE